MRCRTTVRVLFALLLPALAACSAPEATSDSQQLDRVAVASPAPAGGPPATTTPEPPMVAPPMSDPLPPEVLPATGAKPPVLDRSCRTAADCTVKNVGNCCGMQPACVNVNSPTDPAAVQAECAREGRMSVCGFKPVAACACVAGVCEDAGGPTAPVAR